MFRGATLVNLDSKGRLSVPTRYREQLLENAAGQMGNYRAKIIASVEHEPG